MITFIRKIWKNGFFPILSVNIISKVIPFFQSLIVIRLLAKEDYGIWSYTSNLLQWALLFSGFGVASGVLQYVAENDNKDEQQKVVVWGLLWGILINICISIGLIIVALFVPLPIKGVKELLLSLSFFPIISIVYNVGQSYNRAILLNNLFSATSILYFISIFIFTILGANLLGLTGLVIARYVGLIVTVVYILYNHRNIKLINILFKGINIRYAKSFLKFSFICCLTYMTGQILYLIDVFLIGIIIKNPSIIATYKAATLIPFSINIVSLSIMMFVAPYIIKNRENTQFIKIYIKKYFWYLLLLNMTIGALLIIFHKQVIELVFGARYYDMATPFIILVIGAAIAGVFRIPSQNILGNMRKIKINFYIALFAGVVNIILDIYLIISFGINGAAISTLMIMVLTSILSTMYLNHYLKEN